MLTLKKEDADALQKCREVQKNFARYHIRGERYFMLALLMFNELEMAGLIEWEEGVKLHGG